MVALLGPTGAGKTALAAALAQRLPVEVVSADSRQIRRGMRIGTAAPNSVELAAVPHHLVAIVEPDAPWTLADFLDRARAALDHVWSRGHLPLLVGGTGQYVWALLEGLQVPAVPPNAALRAELEETDAAAVHARLEAADPASAARIDARNVRRMIRAIEIVAATGQPVPPPEHIAPDWSWRAVGIDWPREALHQRTDARVDAMYAAGLVAETRALIERYGDDFSALRSVGYAEAALVVAGNFNVASALERTRIATHRLIRQQATWFRRDDARIEWHDGSDRAGLLAAVEAAAHPPVR